MVRWAKVFVFCSLGASMLCAQTAWAQDSQQTKDDRKAAKQAAKERQKRDKDLYKELDSQYKRWLDQDVVYIITAEERTAFLHLSTNEEREQFIEQFWLRRNPDPDSVENTFKEEHYRRIAYANEHYASGIPGWKSDRGRIYIIWGPPDEISGNPAGGTYDRPPEEGGGTTSTYPFEDWRYRYMEGIGNDITLEFVDPSMTGEFHLTMDRGEKDALLYVPGAGLTMAEQLGLSTKADRFTNTSGQTLGTPLGMQPESMNEFTNLERFAKVQQAPPVKFKDLEAVVTSRIIKEQVKFDYRFDFLRITSDTVLVPITVQIPTRQLSFQEKQEVASATVNIFGRITTLSGRPVQTFEDTVHRDVPADLLEKSLNTSSIYQKAVPLSPGLYRLDLVLKDVNSNNVGVVNARLAVPRFEDDKLSTSTLILADQMQRVSARDIGLGQFVLGDVKVRPKMDASFTPVDNMGVFLQVYNLKVDDNTHKANASVEFRVTKEKETEPTLKFDVPQEKLPQHGEELTLQNILTLGSLTPGKYTLEVAVTDHLANQTITPSTAFTVKPAPAPQGR